MLLHDFMPPQCFVRYLLPYECFVLAVLEYVLVIFSSSRYGEVPAMSMQETRVEKVLTLEHAKLKYIASSVGIWLPSSQEGRAACEGVRQLLMHA